MYSQRSSTFLNTHFTVRRRRAHQLRQRTRREFWLFRTFTAILYNKNTSVQRVWGRPLPARESDRGIFTARSCTNLRVPDPYRQEQPSVPALWSVVAAAEVQMCVCTKQSHGSWALGDSVCPMYRASGKKFAGKLWKGGGLITELEQDLENTVGSWELYGYEDEKRYPYLQSEFFERAAAPLARRSNIVAFIFGGAIRGWGQLSGHADFFRHKPVQDYVMKVQLVHYDCCMLSVGLLLVGVLEVSCPTRVTLCGFTEAATSASVSCSWGAIALQKLL